MAEDKVSDPSDGLPESKDESEPKPEENIEEDKGPAVSNTEPSDADICGSDQQKYSDDKPPLHYLRDVVQKDPSLAMRLKQVHHEHLVEAPYNLECIDRWKELKAPNKKNFFRSSKLPNDGDYWILRTCSVCGCATPEYVSESSSKAYCSEECILLRMAQKRNDRKASIFEHFRSGELGIAEIRGEIVDDRAPCTIILKGKHFVYKDLSALWKTPSLLDSAAKGDDVLVKDEDNGYLRGYVLKVNEPMGYKVALIDHSIVVEVPYVYSIPSEVEEIMSFGGVISFKGKTYPKTNYVKFRIKERRLFGVWLCSFLHSDGTTSDIYLEEWFPPLRVKVVPLESRAIVVITHYLDAKTLYVRRMDNHWNEEYILYNNDLNVHCIEAMKYKNMPKIGEICCARHEKDGCFYRAVVRERGGSFVVVTFMDTGVEQETEVTDLRYIPALAKQTPAFCKLIRLKNVKLQSSQGAMKYLKGLTTKSSELILNFSETIPEEAILTKKFNGEVVNDIIRNFETPDWLKKGPDLFRNGRVYTLEHLRDVAFKCGQKEDVYLLNFNEKRFQKSGVFWATAHRWDYLGHLNGEMKERINEYCNVGNVECYIPRKGELCIIKHAENWKRAVALGQKHVSCKVRLVDYGITAWADSRDIRCITAEFLELPALSVRCILSNIQEMDEDGKNIMIAYMKEMKMSVIKDVDVIGESNGNYTMSVSVPPNFEPSYPVTPPEETDEEDQGESAAVTVTYPTDMDFDEVVLAVENCVDFDNLDMENPIYHLMEQGLLVAEVTGENSQKEARLLADELFDVFSQNHKDKDIGCVIQGKVKISGFESHLTQEDVVKLVAEIGGCDVNYVRATTCVYTPATGKIIWIKCPVATAIKIAKGGKIQLLSNDCKIEFLHRRMIRCFRCKRQGHAGAFCTPVPNDKKCSRCNLNGHESYNCRNEPFCELCHARRLPSDHEVYSPECHEEINVINDDTQSELYTEVWDDSDSTGNRNEDNFFEYYGRP